MTTVDETIEIDAQVREAIHMAQAGDREAAVARLRELLEPHPNHGFGQLHLAVTLADMGRQDEACIHAEKALELADARPAFFLFAGRVFLDAENYGAARNAFEQALELSPDNDLAQAYRIVVEWAGGNAEAAYKLDPESLPESNAFLARVLFLIEMKMQGRHIDYVSSNAEVVPLIDRLRVTYMLWRGNAFSKRGDFLSALAVTDPAMELCPGHPGIVAFQQECRESACRSLQRRLKESPESLENHIELAMLLADMDRYEPAAQELSKADRLAAERDDNAMVKSPQVARLRARVAYGMGDMDRALHFTELGREPGFSMAETWYVFGLCKLAQGHTAPALEAFRELVAIVCWAVPIRLREYFEWRRSGHHPRQPSSSET